MVTKVKALIMEHNEDFEMVARLYTLLALISFVLDVISFFIVFGFLAKIQSDTDDFNDAVSGSATVNVNINTNSNTNYNYNYN